MTRIKVCGLTREEDLERCLELSVDFLGFNLWRGSPRRLSPHQARVLVAGSGTAVPVGVFVHGQPEGVDCAGYTGVEWVQLHGTPPGWSRAQIFRPVIRALAVTRALSPSDLTGADYYLLDAAQQRYGGGGKTFDWANAELLAGHPRVFIAGGLTPENVGELVRRFRPYAVDVASGCESAPGLKDAAKLKAFVEAVREVG